MKLLFLLLSIFFTFKYSLAQKQCKLIDTIILKKSNFILEHCYNFTDSTKATRLNMMKDSQNPFYDKFNNYGKLLFKCNGDTAFNILTGAFTELYIDTTNKLIVGLSNITFCNPFQVVILNFSGDVLFVKRIDVMESKLNYIEYMLFYSLYHVDYKMLNKLKCVSKESNNIYISYLGNQKFKKLNALKFLKKKSTWNHTYPRIEVDGFCNYNCFNNGCKLKYINYFQKQDKIVLVFEDSVKIFLNSNLKY